MRKITGLTITALLALTCALAAPKSDYSTPTPAQARPASSVALKHEVRHAKISRDFQRKILDAHKVRAVAHQRALAHQRAVAHAEARRKAAEAQARRDKIARENKKERLHVAQHHATLSKHTGPGGVAACIRHYESDNNYRAQNPNTSASGGYQFIDETWRAVTGRHDRAKDAPPAVQDAAFEKLWDGGRGAHQWTTAHLCGY